jgi:hypothetical protein
MKKNHSSLTALGRSSDLSSAPYDLANECIDCANLRFTILALGCGQATIKAKAVVELNATAKMADDEVLVPAIEDLSGISEGNSARLRMCTVYWLPEASKDQK